VLTEEECCLGLKQIAAIPFCNEPEESSALKGSFYCTKCGDYECKEPENKCNCPAGCSGISIKTGKPEYARGKAVSYAFDGSVFLKGQAEYPKWKSNVIYRGENSDWVALYPFCGIHKYQCIDCIDYNNCKDCENLPGYVEPQMEITETCAEWKSGALLYWDTNYCETSEFECTWDSGQKETFPCEKGMKQAEPGDYKIVQWYFLDENCEGQSHKAESKEFEILES